MARVFTPAEAKRLSLPGRLSSEIVSGRLGAKCLSLRLVEIAPQQPGDKPRGPHVHHGFEECIYVLSGEGVTESDSGDWKLKAGDTILIPAGERHVTRNAGREPLKLLCFFPIGDVASGTQEYPDWDIAKAAP